MDIKENTINDIVDENGRTPFLNLIIDEEIDLIMQKNLAADRSNTMLQDKYGRNALHYILMCAESITVNSLIITIIDFLNDEDFDIIDEQGMTALHYACIHEKFEATISLLERGADHSIADATGKTPLHYASMYGSTNSLGYLIAYHVNVNAVDNDNNTALHLVCIHNRSSTIECIRLLCKNLEKSIICSTNKSGKTAIHLACIHQQDYFTIENILDYLGVIDIDKVDAIGRSALHYAIILHNYNVVRLLLARYAYIDCADQYIKNYLNSTVTYPKNKDIVKLLIVYLFEQFYAANNDNIDNLYEILVAEKPRLYLNELERFSSNVDMSIVDVIEGQFSDMNQTFLYSIKSSAKYYPYYAAMITKSCNKAISLLNFL